MPTIATTTFAGAKLEPAIAPLRSVHQAFPMTTGTYARGTVIGQVTATSRWRAYATGNVDGSQTARAVLMYACVVDAGGNVFLGDTAASAWGESYTTAPGYAGGYFFTTDLVGLDAGAVTSLGKIFDGVLAAGILRIT